VSHSVPAVGYLITSGDTRLIFTGDTGPTDLIWYYAQNLSLLIVELSFPNSMEELAIRTGHLTPKLLEIELRKLPDRPKRVMAMHLKSMYREQIISELSELDIIPVEIMQDGADIRL
jgi:ribonuclease BN (tRNA processing enzyme)